MESQENNLQHFRLKEDQGGVGDGKDFAKDFNNDARESNETMQPGGTEIPDATAGQSGTTIPAAEPEPIFKPQEEEPGEEPIVIKKWTKADIDDNMEVFMNLRNMMQAELIAMYAKEKDSTKYEMDEQQLNKLARVWTPVFKKYGGQIPPGLMIGLTEALIMIPILKHAFDDRKVNVANSKAAANPATQQAAQQAAANKQRKNYTIDTNGYYTGKGRDYVKAGDRTEKASIEDIEFIIRDTEVQIVKKVFPTVIINE